jgi:predicted SAM-dependent methyltransferase
VSADSFSTKLNLGCGHIQPQGWVNVDGSNRAWLASRVSWLNQLLMSLKLLPPTDFSRRTFWANLLKPFPWPTGSVDAIYLGEMLEHFSKEEAEHILRECKRVLRKGGVIRIRVPDNAAFWSHYLDEYRQMKQLPREKWTPQHTRWTRMFFENICIHRPRPWHSMGHFHKWMYDDISLTLILEQIGFAEVQRRAFRDSQIPDVVAVEERDDLIIEARALS